jgi:S1-C subfamily serine protease
VTWDDHSLRRLRQSVLPVRGPHGPIGTGTVIATGLALTAWHVVAPEPTAQLSFGHAPGRQPGLPVRATATLPVREYGSRRKLARLSRQRARALTDSADTSVDLALLTVPELRAPALPVRTSPVRDGEHLIVPGYPGGQWSITRGPVVGHNEADFVVHLLLGPGASGSPVIDRAGRLTGVVTLDNEAGTICVGPGLLEVFLRQMRVNLVAVGAVPVIVPGAR